MKFTNKIIMIEVCDTEDLNLYQDPLSINIEAEAFDISVDLKFPTQNQENVLDFSALKVGEVKEQTLSIKNIGLYKVKFNFAMKKKQFRECFVVEPQDGELDP